MYTRAIMDCKRNVGGSACIDAGQQLSSAQGAIPLSTIICIPPLSATNRAENPFHLSRTPVNTIRLVTQKGTRTPTRTRTRTRASSVSRSHRHDLILLRKTCSASSVLVPRSATPPGRINYLFPCFICLTFAYRTNQRASNTYALYLSFLYEILNLTSLTHCNFNEILLNFSVKRARLHLLRDIFPEKANLVHTNCRC